MSREPGRYASRAALIGAALLFAGSTSVGAQTLNPCSAKKKLCVAKKVACLLKCHISAEKKGVALDVACEQKCMDKFDGGSNPAKGCFEKWETKYPTGCLTYDDTAAAEAKADAFVSDVVQELDPGFPAPVDNDCSAFKKKCVSRKVRGLLKCHAKAERKGFVPDPACLQKVMDRFDGGAEPARGCFAVLEATYPGACLTTGDTATLEAKVDAFVDDVVNELDPVRFMNNGDGTVSDVNTCLQWELKTGAPTALVDCTPDPPGLCPDPHHVNNAYQWCEGTFPTCTDDVNRPPDGGAFTVFLPALNAGGGFAGHTDWRLPTNAELQTLVNQFAAGCGSGSACIEPAFLPVNEVPTYQSSDALPGNTNASNCFSYALLGSGCTKSNRVPVRAVRDLVPCP